MIKIDGKTSFVGLLGWPVSHTKSPLLHNALIEEYGQNLVYLPLPTHPDGVEAAIKGLPALGSLGVNVTVPHKQVVMPFLDAIDSAALAIGAVNTIVFEGEYPTKSTGFNTDWLGFRQDLIEHDVDFSGRDVLILGAGGSARAVIYALLKHDCKIYIGARRVAQAVDLLNDMLEHFPEASVTPFKLETLSSVASDLSAPLIINTTPVGMHPNVSASVWPENLSFPKEAVVYDLIYNPTKTQLMEQAQKEGCKTINGLGMLLGQAAEAFRVWTGINPDNDIMVRALNQES
ncbi:MAG: shikimate dehydrogenase [Chloroflexota bacterium]